jgi:hypothetical protein
MNDFVGRDLWEYDQKVNVDWWDIFATATIILLVMIWAFLHQNKKITRGEPYHYFTKGLIAKMFGSIFFCSIYVFYYGGGDTTTYFESSMAMANLFYQSPSKYFEVMISAPSPEIRSLFNDKTGYPYAYLFYESHTFMVVKLTSIITVLTFKRYYLTSLILAVLSFFAIWRLFLTFRKYVPEIEHQLAWAVLFFPSPLFWGGGVSKDTYTFMATALFVYCAHEFFILKKRQTLTFLMLLLSSWLILSIKPYIFIVLFPGGMLWISYNMLTRIRSPFISFFLFPVMILGVSGVSYYILSTLGSTLDKFSLDKALETAAITSHDLKQDYYGGSSFDIGTFDGTPLGALRLFIPALNAGLFRPYIIEARSLVLLMAGLENAFLMLLTFYVVYKAKVKVFFRIIAKNPLLLFCIIFSVLFGFMIGLTTSNFGALVRFKIPIIPFYVSAMFIIYYLSKKKENQLVLQVKEQ